MFQLGSLLSSWLYELNRVLAYFIFQMQSLSLAWSSIPRTPHTLSRGTRLLHILHLGFNSYLLVELVIPKATLEIKVLSQGINGKLLCSKVMSSRFSVKANLCRQQHWRAC